MSYKAVDEKKDFEMNLKEIEECLEKLNDENIGLHESMEIYKKGMETLKEAQKMLENAQAQCNEIKMQFETKEEE
ncbi:MAG: exodeoxyribonuclease VII small subunit [Helicobacter sp.]|uniref:exodeoxyribonuclease VII small subunit n=2 Tax=Helicobacteraceae TaxID=72293 RepID=UPI002A8210E1|nr:exodeoxyribonuclease VII small subunit [Helicobacter sp.]MDY4426485.1 exodeoxyribonuclease VII small subunit [Helicobacter sp.]